MDAIYLVSTIVGTIDQIEPSISNTGTPTTTNNQQTRQNDQICAILDFYHNDNSPVLEDYCQDIDVSNESLFCCSFRDRCGQTLTAVEEDVVDKTAVDSEKEEEEIDPNIQRCLLRRSVIAAGW